MYITKKKLDRRTVLRGGAAALALPMLDAMIPAFSSEVKTVPKLGFVYFPHGAVMDSFVPKQTGTNFQLSPILQPLESYKDYLTVVSGLRNKPGESSNPHGIVARTWLTCVNPDNGGGPSADQIAVNYIGNDTPLPSIELTCEPGSTTSYKTAQLALPTESNPRKLFQTMFGQGDNFKERVEIVDDRVELLNYVLPEANKLKSKLGAADRERVDQYLETVQELERRTKLLKNKIDPTIPDAPLGTPDNYEEAVDVMFGMITLAWETGNTNIASLMLANEATMRTYPNIGVDEAFHPLSHHGDDPEKKSRLIQVQTFNTAMFAKFVERLSKTADGNGSLLDHSVILFGSNMSNSDLHNQDPIPSVLVGKGGGIKGGQHLAYPKDTPHANLVRTMLARIGANVETFGDSTGVLSEI